MGSQMIQIIILAGIALFLILRLRNVLGTREGYEKPQETRRPLSRPRRSDRSFDVIEGGSVDPDIADVTDPESPTGQALAAMKKVDRDFTVADFSHGARAAYEMIVMAYENGDLDTLRQHLSPEVFAPFAAGDRGTQGQGLHRRGRASPASARSSSPRRASTRPRNEADITMRFVGELTSVVRDPEGRIVEGAPNELKQQKDVWTFTRDMTSDNPELAAHRDRRLTGRGAAPWQAADVAA